MVPEHNFNDENELVTFLLQNEMIKFLLRKQSSLK